MNRPDPIIDALIAKNRAKPIPGMEQPDLDRINRIGADVHRQVVNARQRVSQRERLARRLTLVRSR